MNSKSSRRTCTPLKFFTEDIALGLLLLALLISGRLALYILNRHDSVETFGLQAILLLASRAVLFDLRIISPILLIQMALGLGGVTIKPSYKIFYYFRKGIAFLSLGATLLLIIGNIGFFAEYHDQYNHWVHGLFHDDTKAILLSIWESYPLFWIGLLATCLWAGAWLLLQKMSRALWNIFEVFPQPPKTLTAALLGFYAAALVIGLRGSITSRPLQRDDVSVTPNVFLNKLVLNPYYALYYAYSDYQHLHKACGLEYFLPEGSLNLRAKLAEHFEGHSTNDFDTYLTQVVRSDQPKTLPDHIFFIVLESQDNWPLYDTFASLSLAPNLRRLAEVGCYVPAFISAGNSTRTSLCALISGLPDAGVYTHFQPNSQTVYPTAPAPILSRLGYKTNFFYGGHLSWQRIGEFSKNQGFNAVYGQEHMPASRPAGPWGVWDAYLFDFVLKTIDPTRPTFNMLMTTSNHSPYPVDCGSIEGCPKDTVLETCSVSKGPLRHLWYNDYCVGRFVEEAQKRFPNSLFIITADHTSRQCPDRANIFAKQSIPLIFFGTGFSKGSLPSGIAGSHLDILPTVIEQIAPKEFTYAAFGSPLQNPDRIQAGFGAGLIVTPQYIWNWDNSDQCENLSLNPFEGSTKAEKLPECIPKLTQRYRDYHGLGWWRIMKGPELPE